MELLDRNAGAFVGWGSVPRFSEFAPDGTLRFDAGYPGGGFTYRPFRRDWTAHPADGPAFVVATVDGERSGFASWNGATALAHWRLRTGATKTSLTAGRVVRHRSFETRLPLPRSARFAAVEALTAAAACSAGRRSLRFSRPRRSAKRHP